MTAAPSAPPAAAAPARRRRLGAEFAIFYLATPLVLAFGLPASAMWTLLGAVTLLATALLRATPGFRWRSLLRGGLVPAPLALAGFLLLTAIVAVGLALWLRPHGFLLLPRLAPELWLTILALYPFLSAAPQELVYRALFFERYAGLFGSERGAILASAAVFALGHLFLWNPVALALSFGGGLVFAWAQARHGFLFACLLHAIAGQIVFTSGLGVFFYHGAAPG